MRKTNQIWSRLGVGMLITLLLCTLITAALAVSYPYTTVTTERANLRQKASKSSIAITRVDAGTEVVVMGKSGGYYHVRVASKTGYIHGDYLAAYGSDGQKAVGTAAGYPYEATVLKRVDLHEKNALTSKVLTRLPAGATVTVIGETNSYAQVRYNGLEGFAKKVNISMKSVSGQMKIAKPTAVPTPVPTLAPGEDSGSYETLASGATGNQVTALQKALIELGYLSSGADGVYGEATKTAVSAFQAANDYPATGEADANLQAFLYSGKPLNAVGAATKVKELAPIEGVTVTAGSTGTLVGTIQIRLRELGYYKGSVTMVHDSATVSALKKFQKANGLTADGKAGQATQDLLFSANALASGSTPTPAVTLTPEPTAAPTYQIPGDIVQRGDTGADVRLVQRRLRELGYYRGSIDGKFGAASVTALKKFQRNNGLTDDGKAGKATYDVLFSDAARAAGVTPTPVFLATPIPEVTPEPEPTPVPTPLTRENTLSITLNVSGEEVAALQRRLTALGYYQATVDGVCKADDVAAIRAFQQMNGLKADGIAGFETQSKLYSESAILYSGAVAAGNVGTATTLRSGMTGTEVTQLQERLIALGYLTGKADGTYSAATANAVSTFQKANGLTRDGVAGVKTLQAIYAASAKPAATEAPKSASGSMLRMGDSSSAVKEMQQKLISLGYLTGKADGTFGTRTYNALKAFQRANKLSADGIAGSDTLAALTASATSNTSGSKQTAAAVPTATTAPATFSKVTASEVSYDDWYSSLKAKARKYPYVTVYDFATGISWQVHIFSIGAHADVEPLTASDTARMVRAFGGNTWNPKAVWVKFGDGSVYMASTHSMPHGTQHRTNNNFDGHCCIHFPRSAAQVSAIGQYATSHQATIDAGWRVTQSMQ